MYPSRFVYLFSLMALSSALPYQVHAASELLSYGIEDEQEAFLVRRIAEFWKDQDYQIVKVQIGDFFDKYPKSKLNDHLRGILGDLYFQEGAYDEAIACYQEIQEKGVLDNIILNKLQCYYELNEFDSMVQEGNPYLIKQSSAIDLREDEFHFLMAEAHFRRALQLENEKEVLALLTSAEPLYESVLNSSFSDPTMFALAEIYRLRKENQKAASFFSELAGRHPEQKEEMLFHAALAQSEFDKSLAIETFAKIADKGGLKAKDALLNRLILLFQENRFAEVLFEFPKVISNQDPEKQLLLSYIIGRSYFATEKFDKASEWLEKYIAAAQEEKQELHSTLLMQLNCAQSLHNETLYAKTVSLFEEKFPTDESLPDALFIHAMMQKEDRNFVGAEEKLDSILKNYPQFKQEENLLLEYSLIAFENAHWLKSYTSLNTFLAKFPESKHQVVAWKHLLSNALELVKRSEEDSSFSYTKKHFYDDLVKATQKEEILSDDEKKECLFLKGKIAYEIGQPKEALSHLEKFLSLYPEEPSCAESHLLIALCHHKMGDDPKLFCEHAEKALVTHPNLQNKGSLHLELYNTYLSLIDKTSKERGSLISEKDPLYELAAEHLFQAVQVHNLPIHLENKLWLANFYYHKTLSEPDVYETDGELPVNEAKLAYTRSLELFESVLINPVTKRLISLDEKTSFLEWEVMKLANLKGRSKQYEQKMHILKDLIAYQNRYTTWNWALQKESLLELAKSYELVGHKEEAFETLQFVKTHFQNNPSLASEYAALHTARLRFSMLAKEKRFEDNAEVVAILNQLKECQIRKNPASEPLHLEAALEYAWIRAQMAKESDQATRYLFFLGRIQEDYNNLEDPMIANYHKSLKENRAKEVLYETYMSFVKAEMKRCEASLSLKENKEAATALNHQSQEVITGLSEKTSSHYLKERARMSLDALKKSKIL